MKRSKLISKEDQVFTKNGKYMFTVSMTDRAKELLDDEGWDRLKESWLHYRNRTRLDREEEKHKTIQIARELAVCYNKNFKL